MNELRDGDRLRKVGDRIREIREGLNLSQDEVVRKCDVTKGNLSNIENGNWTLWSH